MGNSNVTSVPWPSLNLFDGSQAPCGSVDAHVLAESIPHIVWVAASHGTIRYVNARGANFLGLQRNPTAHRRRNWLSSVHAEDIERVRAAWERATSTGSEFHAEHRARRFDGTFRWHSTRALPLNGSDGAGLWIGTATDIEDRKQLELSLWQSEQEATQTLTLLESIGAAMPVGFKLVDRDFRILRINQRLATINGLSVEAHLGRTVQEVVPDLWPQLEKVYRRALGGEPVINVEVSTPGTDGVRDTQHWLASYYPVRINGAIIGVGNVVADISERRQMEMAVARNLKAMVETIATTVECRDPYTAGHQRRVADIASAIAQEMGLDSSTVEGVRTAASIHDIGKISIPAEILSKPGRLSGPELELIREHAETGYQIVAGIDFPWPVAEMIRQHHERLDGSGYPRGLEAGDILLGSKIIAVADIVEAMTAHRPYRAGYGIDVALDHIRKESGRLIDGDAVAACLWLFESGRLHLTLTPEQGRLP
jgi:PAS domain S-box-containing protein/putative nucleotidyltransferase with HDIG domain